MFWAQADSVCIHYNCVLFLHLVSSDLHVTSLKEIAPTIILLQELAAESKRQSRTPRWQYYTLYSSSLAWDPVSVNMLKYRQAGQAVKTTGRSMDRIAR